MKVYRPGKSNIWRQALSITPILLVYMVFYFALEYFYRLGWNWAAFATLVVFILIIWAWNILVKRSVKTAKQKRMNTGVSSADSNAP